MEENKVHFFKEIISSIKDFDRYQEYATQNFSKGIKYFLKLMLLMSIIISLVFTIKSSMSINQAVNYLKEESPNFKIENDTLYVDSNKELIFDNLEEFAGIFIIDARDDLTEEQVSEYKTKLSLYNNGVLALKDKVIIKNEMTQEEITKTYKEIRELREENTQGEVVEFSKEKIVENLNAEVLIGIYVSIFIASIIIMASIGIISSIMVSITPMVFGYLTGRIMGLKLRLVNIINIAVHAITLPTVLTIIYVVINIVTGFYIKYFSTMYLTIMYIYIITALFIIRSNLIKQQVDLMKILKEQENVKREMEQQKEQENTQEENKEEEKNQNDDNNIGDEAKGEV